jgi:hypothetical protein
VLVISMCGTREEEVANFAIVLSALLSQTGRLFTFQRVAMSLTHRTIAARLLVGIILSLLALSCKEYEYVSPGPGIVEIRLKVINNREDLIPFGVNNQWYIILKDLNLLQPGGVKLPVYADFRAIRRSDLGDPLNTLSPSGRDSVIVLGQAYAPPESFVGVDLTVNFAPSLSVYRNNLGIPNTILVNPPPPPAPAVPTFFKIPPSVDVNIKINEGRLTLVTVTLNLDSVLVRRSEYFELHPSFSVSSVQNF